MCYLTRWAVDILAYEKSVPSSPIIKIFAIGGLPARLLRALLSADSLFVHSEMDRYRMTREVLDLRRVGWEGENGDIGESSFISRESGEMEESGWEDEEEIAKVFAEGIYYTHMVSLTEVFCRPQFCLSVNQRFEA